MEQPELPPAPRFKRGDLLRSEDLNTLSDRLERLEKLVAELLEWKTSQRSPSPAVVTLDLTPRRLLLLPGRSSHAPVQYPYRVLAIFSDGRRADVTEDCQLEGPKEADPPFKVLHDKRLLVPLRVERDAKSIKVQYLKGGFEKEEQVWVVALNREHLGTKDLLRVYSTREPHPPRNLHLVPQQWPARPFRIWTGESPPGASPAKDLAFNGEDPGRERGVQKVSETFLARLQGKDRRIRCFIVYVRDPEEEGATFRVELGGPAELYAGHCGPLECYSGLYVQPVLVVWEGQASAVTFDGPPVVGIKEIE